MIKVEPRKAGFNVGMPTKGHSQKMPSILCSVLRDFKNMKQTAVINIVKNRILLTFRMLCNIHFQKYDRYKILTTIIYCYEKGLEPTLRQLIYSINLILSLRLKEQQPLTANVGI